MIPSDRPTLDAEVLAALDPGIRDYVAKLRSGGVETFESCQGGAGHAFPEPTIRFHGPTSAGFRALAVALELGIPVANLRLAYPIQDGLPTGPWWEMVFSHQATDD